MPTNLNTLVVHDTEYSLSRSYVAGALAFRAGTPYNCNPHRASSQAHADWDDGHVNESAGEHFRLGQDRLVQPAAGRRFEMDSSVPRNDGSDPDDGWVQRQREVLLGLN